MREHLKGRIERFTQQYHEDWTGAPDWYFDPARSGGGVLLDVGINQIDWIYPLLNRLRPRVVQMDSSDSAVEWESAIEWTFEGGQGRTHLSWRAPREHKTTSVVSDRGEIFELDHQRHTVKHNGRCFGPWSSGEYRAVLENFLHERERGVAKGDPDPADLLDLLRQVYSCANLPFLS